MEEFRKIPKDMTSTIRDGMKPLTDLLDNPKSEITFDGETLEEKISRWKSDLIEDDSGFPGSLQPTIDSVEKYWIYVIVGYMLFGVLMLAMIGWSLASYFTHSRCSRCCASCAAIVPCLCHFWLLLLGLLCSGLCVFIGAFHTIAQDVDYGVGQAYGQYFGEKLVLNPIDLSETSQELLHKPIRVNEVLMGQASKVTVLENVLTADLTKATWSSLLLLNDLFPFKQFADNFIDGLNGSVNDKKQGLDLPARIKEGLLNGLEQLKSMANPDLLIPKNSTDPFGDVVSQAAHPDNKACFSDTGKKANELKSSWQELEYGIGNLSSTNLTFVDFIRQASALLNNDDKSLQGVTRVLVTDMFSSLMSLLPALIPAVDLVSPRPLIHTTNLMVNMIHWAGFWSACASIGAHLFIVGAFFIVLLLWIRRKGMEPETKGREKCSDSGSESDSSKLSQLEDLEPTYRRGFR
jgi:hypothetical protein